MITEEQALDAPTRALVELGRRVRDRVRSARAGLGDRAEWARPVGQSMADVQYGLDHLAERGLEDDARELFGPLGGCALLGEGTETGEPVDLASAPRWLVVLDPVDGTRGLMRDKRGAFFLAGCGSRSARTLGDLPCAVMVEIPTTRSQLSDVLAVDASGKASAWTEDLGGGGRAALVVRPDPARDLRHGFVTFCRFLAGGQGRIGAFAEDFFERAYPGDAEAWASIFEDQYICNGGQLHGLLTGRDLLVVDLRPLFSDRTGKELMASHPYDHCAGRLARAHGVVLTDPKGDQLDAPLVVDHPVPWIGWASQALRERYEADLLAALADAERG